ncbi:MAG: ABC transporter permease [Oscillospiraceae bacterium]|nr:ABC transporter permease [Oscillospiraceae bacterium]
MDNSDFRQRSMFAETWKRLKKNRGAMIGLVIVIILFLLAIFAGVIFDYDTDVIGQNYNELLQEPSWKHPFGTDEMGRDLLARIIYGSRASLFISFAAVCLAAVVGCFFGAISGYFGGRIDSVIMRITDMFLAIPETLFAITLVAALGTGTFTLIIALAISNIPIFCRLLRSSVMTQRGSEHIEAARAIGAKTSTIIWDHILPNCIAPVLVQFTLSIAVTILTISGLSFLGLGVSPPKPEWGALLSSSRSYMREHTYLTIFPGLAIMTTILSLNLLGDGLRDALDPRLR